MTRVFVTRRHVIVFPSFQWFRVDSNTLLVDAYKRRKSLLFQKYPDTSRPGLRKQRATAAKTIPKIVASRSNLSAIIPISWSLIPKKYFQVQKEKEKFIVVCLHPL